MRTPLCGTLWRGVVLNQGVSALELLTTCRYAGLTTQSRGPPGLHTIDPSFPAGGRQFRVLGPMKVIWQLIKWLWWLGLATVPHFIWSIERQFMDQIGCPPRGDCYVPGSEILLGWDVLIMASAFFIWPVCFWFLVVAPIRTWLGPNYSITRTAGAILD